MFRPNQAGMHSANIAEVSDAVLGPLSTQMDAGA